MALPAKERALEVVVVLPAPLIDQAPRFDDRLHLVEEILAHEGLVATLEAFAAVDDDAEVIRVAQQSADLLWCQLLGSAGGGGSGPEPSIVKLIREVLECVFTRGVELKDQRDEVGSLGIGLHSAHFVVVDAFSNVHVADRGARNCAALLRLLAEFVPNVGTVFGGTELVDCGQNAVHELTDRRFINALGRGDERHVVLAKLGQNEGII